MTQADAGTQEDAGIDPALVADARDVLARWTAPDSQQEDLRQRYLQFIADNPVHAADRRLRAGHLTASTVLLDPDRRHVLLTLHPLAGRWFQLGGHCEPGDGTIGAAAAREAAEESGIPGIQMHREPIGLDWHPTTCRDGHGGLGPSSHLDIEHVGIAPEGADPVISSESLELAWFPLDDLPEGADHVVRMLVRRVRALGLA